MIYLVKSSILTWMPFFAAVEIRDNPKLKGKPVVIGSDPRKTGGRGVVSTCSYEARTFGIHSAMSSKEAYERCPQAVFISGNYEKYTAVGQQIRAILNVIRIGLNL